MTPDEAQERFNAVLAQMLREKAIALETLTRDQLADALRQAIAAGDFQRNIIQGSEAQQVVYIPFREVERLKARIAELERAANQMIDAVMVHQRLYDLTDQQLLMVRCRQFKAVMDGCSGDGHPD